jgi:hypothetical protein
MDAVTPTTMVNLPLTEDHRPYLNLPTHDTLDEPVTVPAEAEGSYTEEFSFRAAWELTRSLESLPAPWRHTYRRWNRILSEDHDLSMSAGGAHRYPAPPATPTPPRPPSPAVLTNALSRPAALARSGALRARLCRRLGIVRCARTNQLARDPDSSWTSHAPLDRRIIWAQT